LSDEIRKRSNAKETSTGRNVKGKMVRGKSRSGFAHAVRNSSGTISQKEPIAKPVVFRETSLRSSFLRISDKVKNPTAKTATPRATESTLDSTPSLTSS
jgi:hypothetical protein